MCFLGGGLRPPPPPAPPPATPSCLMQKFLAKNPENFGRGPTIWSKISQTPGDRVKKNGGGG